VAAGNQLGVRKRGKKLHRLGDRSGAVVVELVRIHRYFLFAVRRRCRPPGRPARSSPE
jgi:hypothetical protein